MAKRSFGILNATRCVVGLCMVLAVWLGQPWLAFGLALMLVMVLM